MFAAPSATLDDLPWHPVGPGPDPAVLLETRFAINGTAFRVLGFRVPMPYSAGWSRHAYWEDDKALHGEGLVWDVASFRDFVRQVDEAPDDTEEPTVIEGEGVDLDGGMQRLAETWARLSQVLEPVGQDWRPAMVDGAPYILLGYPEGPAGEGLRQVSLDTGHGRSWFGKLPRQHNFNLSIHGGLFGVACTEVRLLASDGRTAARALDPEAAAWKADVDALIASLPDATPPSAFLVGGRAMWGLLAPVDVEAWTFDADDFIDVMSRDLPPARMRWSFDLPPGGIDAATAEMLEGLAQLTRERRFGRIGNEIYFASRTDVAAERLGLSRPPRDTAELKNMLYMRLGRVVMRALGRREDDSCCLLVARVIDKAYLFRDRVYLAIAPAFVRMAADAPVGVMLDLVGRTALETHLDEQIDEPPDWVGQLPVVVDSPIRAIVGEVSTMSEGV